MKTITIGFSSPSKWKIGAEAIKLWTHSPYSHVYIRYEDDQGRDIVFEAAHGSVHSILYSNFKKDNTPLAEIKIDFTLSEYQDLRDFYYSEMGQLYAYKDLIVIVLHDILKKVGIKLNDSNIPGYICSQLAATMLSKIKKIKFDKPLNLIRPDDLYEALIKKAQ